MDFIDQIKAHAARVARMKDNCQTEEATKMSLVIPFFKMLGWDVFNPEEFLPEFTADVGIKKGEKVDYALVVNGAPTVLIECKWSGSLLDKHDSQLFRYFATTTAKFAILTNGLVYKFYTDLDEKNKMDLTPFLEIDLLNLNETLVPEVKRFHKDSFDTDSLTTVASELKYSKAIKKYFAEQLTSPDDEFVRFFTARVYDGSKTQTVVEKFTVLVRAALNDFITERLNERLKTALGDGAPKVPEKTEEVIVEESAAGSEDDLAPSQAELEALYIVRALVAENIPTSDITCRKLKGSFSIFYKSSWNWICRLRLSDTASSILIPDENKSGEWLPLENGIDSIFQCKQQLREALGRYMKKQKKQKAQDDSPAE